MSEDVRADALARNSCTLFETLKEHRHSMFGEWFTRLGEKDMIFPSASPISELLRVGSVLIEIVGQITETVLPQGHTPFLCSLPHPRHHALLAIQILHSQMDQF